MATLLLSAAGAAIGGSFGGSLVGLTTGALGKAAGATFGALIDQRIAGLGSEPVEAGRVERFRVMGASEGGALPRAFGRVRVAGQVIWSSRFLETINTTRVRGKGGGQSQEAREFTYSVSLAIALCEGEVVRVGRVWADGQALDLSGLAWRLHVGSEAQIPDPVISAIEGADEAPAYRGTAYVVLENLDLTQFGNRIPQFNFEVFRRAGAEAAGLPRPPALDVRGVALVPGTGEYALATEPIYFKYGKGHTEVKNVNNDRGRPDFLVSLEQLQAELPQAKAVSLVVSWFGDDLRCDRCRLQPAVEQVEFDGQQMPWRVSGLSRVSAKVASRKNGRPVFGGTPADASVLQAIQRMNAASTSVMFYPFLLMDILPGNALPDPWSAALGQPAIPWRGRVTLSTAPGRPGSPDKRAAAADQVAAFFGAARPTDFRFEGGTVVYAGPSEWSYRRFILHYAHLCAASDGVDAFCIGSEMRSLTQIRDSADGYPAVRALCALAADVRAILGAGVKIGYAADWSEYFGHQPADGSGDALFHLDPLWAHPAIDFVGIDNYMPLADWRDGSGHADAPAGSIYDLDYLAGNVAGGEGFDWYYADAAGREAQQRLPIADGAYGEDWMFRYKDIANWWSRPHTDRIGGVRRGSPTDWVPRSKPVWFTELGCPAVNKGANQPNVFFDPKSSESFLPYHSNGGRDDFMQRCYLQAMYRYWNDDRNNPVSDLYPGRMVDMGHAFVWAWDARPWPDFPHRLDTWIDGRNFARGHWINARAVLPALAEVVAEICARSGVQAIDVSELHGGVTGYLIGSAETARQSLQPLMLGFGFDSFGAEGRLAFISRGGRVSLDLAAETFAATPKQAVIGLTRGSNTEAPGRISLGFVRADMDYQAGAVQAVSPEAAEPDTAQSSVPIVLSEAEAQAVAERWLSEGRVALDSIKFDLPPSVLAATPGDVVSIGSAAEQGLFRIDRIAELGVRSVTAIRIEPSLYEAAIHAETVRPTPVIIAPTPVYAEFLDLPLLSGDERPYAPHVAVAKTPWAGPVAVFSASDDFGYRLNLEVLRPATVGETLQALEFGEAGRWMRRSLRVRLATGRLQSAGSGDVLDGGNVVALRFGGVGDWEVLQFQTAVLVAPNEYEIKGLLRGQAGTDGIARDTLPAGADLVLLDESVVQLNLNAGTRGLARHYRIGPAGRPYDDASYIHELATSAGVGLRPYRPAHLALRHEPNGDIRISWIRRTRIDGDNWESVDVPLGESREVYEVWIRRDGHVRRAFTCSTNVLVYDAADQIADGAAEGFVVEVSQVSEAFGPGPRSVLVHSPT